MKVRGGFLGAVVLLAGVGTLALSASASAAPVATFSNPQPISIPASGNGSPYPSTIVVSGLSGLTTDVNVAVRNVSHTYPDDVGILLVGPSGQALLLEDGAGDASDLVDVTTIFDDSAASPLPNATAWPSGSYKPTGHVSGHSFPAPGPGFIYDHPGPAGGGTATLSSTFAATNPNGAWKLYVRDFVLGESGTIAGGWSLQLQTTIADNEAPETTIQSAPSGTIPSSSASVAFSANEFATFECSLDSAAFTPCTSPHAYSSLSEGPHTVAVRATDPSANVESTPATAGFTVDTVAPVTTIDSGPSGSIPVATATLTFSANEPAAFKCRLDSAAFTPCVSPQEYAGLAEGQHTFELRATDLAGNVDVTGATRPFTVNTIPPFPADSNKPLATITKPKPKKGKRTAIVEFAATDDRTSIEALTFTCALDGSAAKACTSPTTYKRLSPGRHTISVVATDLAGNASLPAKTRFKIKRK